MTSVKLWKTALQKKTSTDWLAEATNLAKPKAEQSDANAMYIMYELTMDRSWLGKSATVGDATAQFWMAIGDKRGEGFLLLGSLKMLLAIGLKRLPRVAIHE